MRRLNSKILLYSFSVKKLVDDIPDINALDGITIIDLALLHLTFPLNISFKCKKNLRSRDTVQSIIKIV